MKQKISFAVLLIGMLLVGGCGSKDKQVDIDVLNTSQQGLFQEYRAQIPQGSVTKTIDLEKSTVRWTGRKSYGDTSYSGTVDIQAAELYYLDGILIGGQFVMDMNTIKTDGDVTSLDDHLKNEDFFDVVNFPTSRIAFTLVRDAGLKGVKNISGDLSIKDVRRNIQFPAKIESVDGVEHATAQFKLDRTLWGITYGSGKFFKELGDKMIDDMMEFDLDIYTQK
ncbi:YceI family protein [Candidatus Nomurabacteria bacterium]|nr:YceI family protein [Candidatus Nomurabacteria bacterium]